MIDGKYSILSESESQRRTVGREEEKEKRIRVKVTKRKETEKVTDKASDNLGNHVDTEITVFVSRPFFVLIDIAVSAYQST